MVERGLAPSRESARALIELGLVRARDSVVVRPAQLLPDDAPLEVVVPPRYVSRGGEKLAGALAAFGLDVSGRDCVDIGASTGGFTDCLLQHGARRVVAVDVGRGLLHQRVALDTRVVRMEGVNARDLPPLPFPCSVATVDVAFISLRLVLPPLAARLGPGADIVALVKPQFEARRGEVGKGGIVRDPAVRHAVLGRMAGWLGENGFWVLGFCRSPILGGGGNVEYFLHLRHARE